LALDRHDNFAALVARAQARAIDIAPVGLEPRLVGKAVKSSPAHVYAGASLLVASR
jgi:hypothetical protein